ncbi:MAG TPA: diaminopimelate epimerase [Pyrinomonadaceae bacterium]|jgi:diaminopimelate epimerase
MKINFCKFHGFGNDYIVIENEQLRTIKDLGAFAKRICHRHTGVGADGIAVLEKLETEADYSCRIINPDGSEAGFSGNGTRCAVAYLYYKNLYARESLKLQTKSGVKNYRLLKCEENTFWFLAELGKPNFDLPHSPFWQTSEIKKQNGKDRFNLLLASEGLVIGGVVFVDVGNPVVCIFLGDFVPIPIESGEIDWRQIGRKIESAEEMFPDRTNVVFIKILDRNNIEIRIWERGAGETASSGTCSIAAAVASAFTGQTERKVSVGAPGGTTEAVWREDGEMLITGRADLSFCGEWLEND